MYIYQFSDKSNEMFYDEETFSPDAQISDPDDLKLFKRYDKNSVPKLNQTDCPILAISTL